MGIFKYNKTNELGLVQSAELAQPQLIDASMVGDTQITIPSIQQIITNTSQNSNLVRKIYPSGNYSSTLLPLPAYTYGIVSNEDASVIMMPYGNGSPYKSTDYGVTWTEATIDGNYYHRLVYGNGVWLATRNYSTSLFRSDDDGSTWSEITGVSYSSYPSPTMRYFNGLFILMPTGASSEFKYSSDGITWTAGSVPSTTSGWVLAVNGSRLWAVERTTSSPRIMMTSDGINWAAYSNNYAIVTSYDQILNADIGFEYDSYVWFPTGTHQVIARYRTYNPASTGHITGLPDGYSNGFMYLKKMQDPNGKTLFLGFSSMNSTKYSTFKVLRGTSTIFESETKESPTTDWIGIPSDPISMPATESFRDWNSLA